MPDFSHLSKLATSTTIQAEISLPEIAVPGQELAADGTRKAGGCVPTLLVVTTGEKNTEYTRRVAAVAVQYAKQRGSASTEQLLKQAREARERFRALAPAHVIKGWRNVYETTPAGPREVPFSVDACAELLAPEDFKDAAGKPKPGLPDQLVDRLRDFCADDGNFTIGGAEALAKN